MISYGTASISLIVSSGISAVNGIFTNSSLVPLIRHFVLPVRVLLDLMNTVLDDGESLSNLEIIHVFLVVELIGKL